MHSNVIRHFPCTANNATKRTMGYPSLQACVQDLQRSKQLVVIDELLDPHLEIAALQRRVYEAGGPAYLCTKVKGCQFPVLGNLFGTIERTRYIFRDAIAGVQQLIALKGDPGRALQTPRRSLSAIRSALHAPAKIVSTGPVVAHETALSKLPQLVSWPDDGGAFITLPQIYSEHPERAGWRHANLGMYRVQLGGNDYTPDQEVGLHYQIHRGIGVHHQAALASDQPFRVNIFVGGPPAMSLAAVMPLPEGVPEIAFAGALNRRRVRMIARADHPAIHADADFCISGVIIPGQTKPEGPFGDHLGYYSLQHDYPVLKVEHVYHRKDAIWPFTVVGRPPQEDTSFGEFIHELAGAAIPDVLPGVQAVHAVDAAGVHPLLLAIGAERYTPFEDTTRPQEILTQANAILGQGQLSLAKYLLIANTHDDPCLDIHDIEDFFRHMLERVDWTRDLHFHTRTTIDTLDYSGHGHNQGSKVVIAASGPAIRGLPIELPREFYLPESFRNPRLVMPGIMAIEGDAPIEQLTKHFSPDDTVCTFPLLIVCDDATFTSATLNNFLWTVFTKSDPAQDIHGVGARIRDKHWGCSGSLVIDARSKPHHAPPLVSDKKVEARIDELLRAHSALATRI